MSKYTKEEIVRILKEYAEDNYNQVDLSGTDFERFDFNFEGAETGNVDFEDATTGNVNFKCATTDNVDFRGTKTGDVCFYNATTKNVNFTNATTNDVDFEYATTGGVFFQNTTTNNFYTNFGKCTYGGKVYNSINLDNFITAYDKPKKILGFTIYEDVRARTYTKYAITNGVFNAHSGTIKGAIEDLRYKIETFKKDKKPIIDKIKKTQVVSKQDYRIITGACEAGINDFCNRHNITADNLPLDKVLELFKDKYDYGIREFLKYMEE